MMDGKARQEQQEEGEDKPAEERERGVSCHVESGRVGSGVAWTQWSWGL